MQVTQQITEWMLESRVHWVTYQGIYICQPYQYGKSERAALPGNMIQIPELQGPQGKLESEEPSRTVCVYWAPK